MEAAVIQDPNEVCLTLSHDVGSAPRFLPGLPHDPANALPPTPG